MEESLPDVVPLLQLAAAAALLVPVLGLLLVKLDGVQLFSPSPPRPAIQFDSKVKLKDSYEAIFNPSGKSSIKI